MQILRLFEVGGDDSPTFCIASTGMPLNGKFEDVTLVFPDHTEEFADLVSFKNGKLHSDIGPAYVHLKDDMVRFLWFGRTYSFDNWKYKVNLSKSEEVMLRLKYDLSNPY